MGRPVRITWLLDVVDRGALKRVETANTSLQAKLRQTDAAYKRTSNTATSAAARQAAAADRVTAAENRQAATVGRLAGAWRALMGTQNQVASTGTRAASQSDRMTQAMNRQAAASQRAAMAERERLGVLKTVSAQTAGLAGGAITRNVGVGVAAVGGFGLIRAAKDAANFEQQMANVNARLVGTHPNMQKLGKFALKMGEQTVFSATEAASALDELARMGFTANQSMGTLRGTLDLAAATGTDLAEAARIQAVTLRGFGLQAKESGAVADVLAKAVNRSSLDMYDLGYALKYIAPVAKATGQGFEDMMTSMALMSNVGIQTTQLGTTLRTAISRLTAPTDKAKDALARLGLTAKELQDPDKGLKPLPEILRLFAKGAEDVTVAQRNQAIVTIFGREALSGMVALMEKGPKKVAAFTKELNNSTGAADRASDIMRHTVAGRWEYFTSTVETSMIRLSKTAMPALEKFLKNAGDGVKDFVSLIQDPNLSGREKWSIAFRKLGELLAQGLEKLINVAKEMAPKVAQGFAAGFASANIWAKLGMSALLIRMFGGKGAIKKTGVAIAGWLFSGIAAGGGGAAAARGGAAAAGGGLLAGLGATKAGGWLKSRFGKGPSFPGAAGPMPRDPATGQFMKRAEGAGKLGFKGIASGFLKKAGWIGLGYSAFDAVMTGFGQAGTSAVGGRSFGTVASKALAKNLTFGLSKSAEEETQETIDAMTKTIEENAPKGIEFFDQSLDWETIDEKTQAALEAYEQNLVSVQRLAARGINVPVKFGTRDFSKDMDRLANGFEVLRRNTFSSMGDIRLIVNRNMKTIAKTLGADSKAGRHAMAENIASGIKAVKRSLTEGTISTRQAMRTIKMLMAQNSKGGREAVLRNFQDAASAIQQQMKRGEIATKEGTRLIRGYIVAGLKDFGMSKSEAIQWYRQSNYSKGTGEHVPINPNFTGRRGGTATHAGFQRFRSGGAAGMPSLKISGGGAIGAMTQRGLDIQFAGLHKFLKRLQDALGSAAGNIVALGRWAQKKGLSVGEHPKFGGVGGSHAPGSFHYQGRAIDVSGSVALMRMFANTVARTMGAKLKELFWRGPGWVNIDNGKRVGYDFVTGHKDHVHVAMRGGGLVDVAASSGELMRFPNGSWAGVPGPRVAADNVRMSVPNGTEFYTGHGQSLLASGFSRQAALQTQMPHFREGGRLSAGQMSGLAMHVGLRRGQAIRAGAIGMPESHGDPRAHALTSREDSRGLWQINVRAHPWGRKMDLYDPETNAKAMKRVSSGGSNWGPWTGYTSGAYRAYLNNAANVVQWGPRSSGGWETKTSKGPWRPSMRGHGRDWFNKYNRREYLTGLTGEAFGTGFAAGSAGIRRLLDVEGIGDLIGGARIEGERPDIERRVFRGGPGGGTFGALKTVADKINDAKYAYQWGGGHGVSPIHPTMGVAGGPHRGPKPGYDCSGAVGRLLQEAAIPGAPKMALHSSGYGGIFAPGRGKRFTIHSTGSHVWTTIGTRGWGTSSSNPRGGPGWHAPRSGGVMRHPKGMRGGGVAGYSSYDQIPLSERMMPFGSTLGGYLPGMATGGVAGFGPGPGAMTPRQARLRRIIQRTWRRLARISGTRGLHNQRPSVLPDFEEGLLGSYRPYTNTVRLAPYLMRQLKDKGGHGRLEDIARGTLLHEMIHSIQRITGDHYLRKSEGGSEAFLQLFGKRVFGKRWRPRFGATTGWYRRVRRQIMHSKSNRWIKRGQFHFRGGGVAMRNGGIPKHDDFAGKAFSLQQVGARGFDILRPLLDQIQGFASKANFEVTEFLSHLAETLDNAGKITFKNLTRSRGRLQKQIRALIKGGTNRREEAQIKRLRSAIDLVEAEMGRRVGRLVFHQQRLANHLTRATARLDQRLRRAGIDQSSAEGLQALIGFQDKTTENLRKQRDDLREAIRKARKAGDKETVQELTGQLKDLKVEIGESVTRSIELWREAVMAVAQEGINLTQFRSSAASGKLSLLEANQRLSRTTDTPGGMIQRANLIKTSVLPALQAETGAIRTQIQAAALTGDKDAWMAGMLALQQNATDIANAMADAADLIREAAVKAAQDIVDKAAVKVSLANIKMEALSISQRAGFGKAGTADTSAGMIQQASLITSTIIPALKSIQSALYGAYKTAVSQFGSGSAEASEALIAWQQAGNDLASAMADASELLREAALTAAESLVNLAGHNSAMVDLGKQRLELEQRLAKTFDTTGGGIARVDYINNVIIPALNAELAALANQLAVAQQQKDTDLANSIAEAIAGKQNDILQAQLDAQEETAENTEKMLERSGSLGYEYGGQQMTDLIGAGTGV